jgi:large subunit ribosomal protein L25
VKVTQKGERHSKEKEMAHEEIIIKAIKRTVKGKQVGTLRRAGQLPGVIYGRHIEAFPIQMDYKEFANKIFRLTSSSLVTIDVEGETHAAILRDKQKDVINGHLLHVDFLAVSLTEKLRTRVSIELVGKAPVSEIPDTVIVQAVNQLEIECYPQDLPDTIKVDISSLVTMDDVIIVGSIDLGDKIEVFTDKDEVIASVTYVAQEIVPEVVPSVAEIEPEVMEKGKKPEEAEEEKEK